MPSISRDSHHSFVVSTRLLSVQTSLGTCSHAVKWWITVQCSNAFSVSWKFEGKMNNVEEELNKYKVKVDASRRTGKARELENHKIDLGLYSTSAKTCGFSTENPVDWVRLFEKFYATHEQLKCE